MDGDLSPDEVERQQFTTSRRGYTKEEVDAYLRALAEDVRNYLRSSSERLYVSLGEEMGGLLQHARDSADEMIRSAEQQVAAIREEALADADGVRSAADTYSTETRAQAEGSARETRAQAERSAQETRARAEQDAAERIKVAEDNVRALQESEREVRSRLRSLRIDLEDVTGQILELEKAEVPAAGDELPEMAAETKIDEGALVTEAEIDLTQEREAEATELERATENRSS